MFGANWNASIPGILLLTQYGLKCLILSLALGVP
jgi:hypothetical protein